MNKKSIRDLPDSAFNNKRVLVRVDYNVPLEDGRVTDDKRIRETIPSIQYLLDRSARVILTSHLGRPKGKWNAAMSLKPAADHLRTLISATVQFVSDVVGAEARAAVDALK